MPRQSIEVSEKAGVRYLHFSADWIQGAMRIRLPNALELAYTREMMAGLLLREPPWPRHVLLVGLGAGSLVKFIYHRLPETRMTVVEIDPQVEIIARLHFQLPVDSQRIRMVIGDGVEYMLAGGPAYDAILVDGFDKDGKAGALDSLPFYQACRARLAPGGLLSVNLLGRNIGFAASSARIIEAFDGRALIFPSGDSGNAVALACDEEGVDVGCDELITRADRLAADLGLKLAPAIPRMHGACAESGDRIKF